MIHFPIDNYIVIKVFLHKRQPKLFLQVEVIFEGDGFFEVHIEDSSCGKQVDVNSWDVEA